MNNIYKEIEVYNYVKVNASEYLSIIIQALNDGIKEENQVLKEKKSKVEGGLVSLFSAFPIEKFKKLKPNMKETLKDALLSCTFFVFNKEIKELEV